MKCVRSGLYLAIALAGFGCAEIEETVPMVDDTPATGGVIALTGGVITATGGVITATGGVIASTGGVITATGGVIASTGGVITATGGQTTNTGGIAASTGGVVNATGGAVIATGGEIDILEPPAVQDRTPAADNPAECPDVAPDNPVGDCAGLPIYLGCNYGTYNCVCDWYHWICLG